MRAWERTLQVVLGGFLVLFALAVLATVGELAQGSALEPYVHATFGIVGWETSRWASKWLRARRYGPADGRSLDERLHTPYRYVCPEDGCDVSFATSDPGVTANAADQHARTHP